MGDPLPPASDASRRSPARRLGLNAGGYFGEKIDITGLLKDCEADAREEGWKLEWMSAAPKPDLAAYIRRAQPEAIASPRIYVSAGIHGDEPAGPLAIREMFRRRLWPAHASFWVCPCLNPTGFFKNTRENDEGTDLNRQYLQPKAEETVAHIRWLEQQPDFDLCLCLHEDWEAHGFYLYELNPDDRPALSPGIIKAVEEICPVDQSEVIEGRPAQGGIIRPSVDPRSRPLWPESFFLLNHKTRLSYTLEAASDFSLETRVAGLVAAVLEAIEAVRVRR